MNRCVICGSILSDSNLKGIGAECLKSLTYAKMQKILNNDDLKNKYFHRDLDYLKSLIKEELNKKLRNTFKINFLNTIINQNFISKKQREILSTMIVMNDEKHNNILEENKEKLLDSVEVTREEIEKARKIIRSSK